MHPDLPPVRQSAADPPQQSAALPRTIDPICVPIDTAYPEYIPAARAACDACPALPNAAEKAREIQSEMQKILNDKKII